MKSSAGGVSLVVMGAGESTRFRRGLPIKKQWLRIGERPLWLYVTENLASSAVYEKVIVTAAPAEVRYMQKQCDFEIVAGGESRQDSLTNALESIESEYVLVSDTARFDLPPEVIARVLAERGKADCVAPVLGVSDTICYKGAYLERESLQLIQTPQLSRVDKLREALLCGQFTDESSAISAHGGKVLFVEGSERLKKLTHPKDLALLRGFEPPFAGDYVGLGFDVHALIEGEGIVLGGVQIPAPFAFVAHSDGDVAIHALIDAILGAVGAGDIGEWFPDTDQAYKGVDSTILLRRILEFVTSIGFEIGNVDLTVMAQAPKLSPYKLSIEKRLSEVMRIPLRRISLKATTTESLGFVGRGEGVAVMAQATLRLVDWTKQTCGY